MIAYQLVVHSFLEDHQGKTCENAHWIIDKEGAKKRINEKLGSNHTDNQVYNRSTIGLAIQGYLTEEVYVTAVKVAADILHRHRWSIHRMIQHSDVMNCEGCGCPNNKALNWKQFCLDVNDQLNKH
ncbi:peptidoglycan recognition protein family protein [Brevibacillus laterosporus]|uniref:peptidoglycan recognition protein family protein n=1 Tax=Brevibacillus laterosporus TaxID=1465 RepID=UPI0013CED6F7|nr:N-acetylmuramoyl-L-alanine amidase [Brevibacillus laterosporus]